MDSRTISPTTLNADRLRKLAAERLRAIPGSTEGTNVSPSDFDLNPGYQPDSGAPLKLAAVLVGICARDPLTVLLTERTPNLTAHAGQIAFPGGRIDDTDPDAEAAALREANEEIGLDSRLVERLGYLDPYRTSTGYLITPVVALITPRFNLSINPAEVADVFEVPLAFLMNETNHRIESREWRGAKRQFYTMPYEQHYIWGATAGIIRSLSRRLFTS
ncbi:MAG TPA: CoA pyrophosphatase [Hyphomicrobium sp.]|nr:CoA pyrophosphatase [Hyphomicrobium sp.]